MKRLCSLLFRKRASEQFFQNINGLLILPVFIAALSQLEQERFVPGLSLEQGRIKILLQSVDLSSLISQVVREYQPQAIEKKIKLFIDKVSKHKHLVFCPY